MDHKTEPLPRLLSGNIAATSQQPKEVLPNSQQQTSLLSKPPDPLNTNSVLASISTQNLKSSLASPYLSSRDNPPWNGPLFVLISKISETPKWKYVTSLLSVDVKIKLPSILYLRPIYLNLDAIHTDGWEQFYIECLKPSFPDGREFTKFFKSLSSKKQAALISIGVTDIYVMPPKDPEKITAITKILCYIKPPQQYNQ